jgi:CubicO group peptidase (beta-lactamase class C family)
MKINRLFPGFIFLFIGFGKPSGQSIINSVLPKSDAELIRKYASPLPDRTRLSIARIRGTTVAFTGVRKVSDSLAFADTRDSVFEIGSITKVFTAALLADLVRHHAVELDDPISCDLPFPLREPAKNGKPVTYRTLANHTSGLPRDPDNNMFEKTPDNPFCGYSVDSLNQYLRNLMSLQSTPGERYVYSNLGFGLLGYLLELKTGKSYENLLAEKIFSKYRMISSSSDRNRIRNRIIQGLDSTGTGIPNWDLNAMKPAGAVLSNASDLARFVQANFTDDPVLRLQRLPTYLSSENNAAMGWSMSKYGAAEDAFWYVHEGGTGGYRSAIFMDPDNKVAVIILSNVSVYHPLTLNIGQLAYALMKELFISKKIRDRKSDDAPFLEIALKKGWGTEKNDATRKTAGRKKTIVGVWRKKSPFQTRTYTFMPDRKWQSDFFNDPEIDVWGVYSLEGSSIALKDLGGAACDSTGSYEYSINGDTLRFSAKSDPCDGRRNGLVGIWLREK